MKELSHKIEIPEEMYASAILNDYAVQTRYPGDYTPIGEDEYNNAIKVAKNCVQWVEKKMKDLVEEDEAKKIHPYLDSIAAVTCQQHGFSWG
jgi:HEPN domain-containing protein